MVAFSTTINSLKLQQAHFIALQRTPFWHLFEAFVTKRVNVRRKRDEITAHMIKQYKPTAQAFRIGGVDVKINPFDVSVIFGIINGDVPINLSYIQKKEISFIQRRFAKDSQIKISKIKTAIAEASLGNTKEDIEDVARLLCLLLCGSFFFRKWRRQGEIGFC